MVLIAARCTKGAVAGIKKGRLRSDGMKTLDKTPRPKRPSPLRFEVSAAPDLPAVAKKASRRRTSGGDALRLRKLAQKNANYEKLTAQAHQGLLSVSQALCAPHLFRTLKGRLASDSQVLQLDSCGKLMRAIPVETFVPHQALLPTRKKVNVGELMKENSKFAARLLLDSITQWSFRGRSEETSSKPRADLLSIFHLLVDSRGRFMDALEQGSHKIPNLLAAASRINVALVFIPAIEAPIPVRKTSASEPAKETSATSTGSLTAALASLSLLPRRKKKAPALNE